MSPYRKRSAFLRSWLLDLPIRKKLYVIIGLLIGDIIVLILLGIFALNTVSSVRASVAAQDLWAKAQKASIYSLGKYALTREEGAYQEYLKALKIPIAYDRANREFRKSRPDLKVLRQALIEGRIHPKDLPGVETLFLNFRRIPHVASAFFAWAEAQALMDVVQNVGRQLRGKILSKHWTKEEMARSVETIDDLNRQITTLEIRFSDELGEASRWATKAFIWVMIGGSLLIGSLSVAIALYISNGIVLGVEDISRAASRAARGDLKVRVSIPTRDELGSLGEAFNHMAEGLGKLDRLKSEFFANISHEFRTPLALMLGPLEGLLSSRDLTTPREPLEIVYRNALRLLKLVNALLDFSRFEAGKSEGHYVPTDLSAFTVDLASHFASAMEKAGLKYEVNCRPTPAPLYVDRDEWETLVFNLLSNALKFTMEGAVSVRLDYDSQGARLQIRDTGIGIPKVELPHLFERFHRTEGVRSRTHEGSGIGLSLVHEIARLHGGSVEVESTEGKGTIFSVRLPFGCAHLPPDQCTIGAVFPAKVRTAALHVQEAGSWVSGEGSTPPAALVSALPLADRPCILVVEDNADMRAHIARLLSPYWNIEMARDGCEALESIQRRQPDLVLSDIMMPKMDGFELLRRLRQAPATQHLSIILLSARAGEESRVEGIDAGADDYVIKPFSARELVARVKVHLTMAQVRKELATSSAIISRLEAERKWLESALNLEPVPLLLMEPGSGRITFANRSADSMAGGAFPKNVPVTDYAKTYKITDEHGQTIPVDRIPLARAARGEKLDGQSMIWHFGTRCIAVLVSADALLEMHGHPRTILLTFQDVTPLSQMIQSRDEFLSIASHELRTPVTSLRMQLQMAQRELNPAQGKSPSSERLEKVLRIFTLQTDRLKNLVEDLLDLSRIRAGRLSLDLEACSLSEVMKLTVERLSPQLAEARCPLELDIEEGVDGIWDRKRIEQVIVNLVINATKYARGKPIRVSLSSRDSHACFSIIDFGPGIAKENQATLFDRFNRAVSKGNASGLGLGLFISKEIIEAHGGSINLLSEPGAGCTFSVSLPRRRQATAKIGSGDKGRFESLQAS